MFGAVVLLIIIASLFISSLLMRRVAKEAVELSARMLEDLKEARREKWEREKQIVEIAHNNYLRGRAEEAMEIRRDYELKPKKVVSVKEIPEQDKKKREEAVNKGVAFVKDFLTKKLSDLKSGDKGEIEVRFRIKKDDGGNNRL
jgi:predicted exporter